MKRDARKYLLGSVVSLNASVMVTITSMTEEEVGIVHADGSSEKVPWHHIRPISLDPSYIQQIGFNLHKKTEYPHHTEYIMDLYVGGKFVYCKGVVLKDRSLWNIFGVTVRYLHEIQSVIWIINPNYTFDLKTTK